MLTTSRFAILFFCISATLLQADNSSYDNPYATKKREELPPLELLFGGKVPDYITHLITKLKSGEYPLSLPSELAPNIIRFAKNAILLYGPPETGKTLIACSLAIEAQVPSVYFETSGHWCRSCPHWTGSPQPTEIIEKLIPEALRRADAANKPCFVIIPKIDAILGDVKIPCSYHDGHRSSEEFLLKFLKLVGTYNIQDKRIIFICTANNPKKLCPVLRHRHCCLEIKLPNLENRKRILEYHFSQNDIPVSREQENGVSPDFLEILATATDGLSGKKLADIVSYAKFTLKNKHESLPDIINFPEDLYPLLDLGKDIETAVMSLFDKATTPFEKHLVVHLLGLRKDIETAVISLFDKVTTTFEKHLVAQCWNMLIRHAKVTEKKNSSE